MAPRHLLGSLGLAALMLAGCSHGMTVRGAVLQPAQVPVRAFPRILVTCADDPDAARLADLVARHLAESGSEVRRVSLAELARLREEQEIGPATAVLRVTVAVSSRRRPQWARRRQMTCGPLGCTDTQRPYVRDIPLVVGDGNLRVMHGPSGRELQREAVHEEESGLDDLGARLRVLERIGRRMRDLIDQRTEEVRVELYPIDHPTVRAALDAIRVGRWREGRRQLERFTEADGFDELPREQRAVVRYDLGQARRFDRSLPPHERFRLASESLRAAVRLDPAPRYANALAALAAHQRSRAMVARQREATAHNFGLLATDDGGVPEPPVNYR